VGSVVDHADGGRGLHPSAGDVLQVIVVCLPIAAFSLVMVWLSEDRIAPSAAVEGSSTNPLGILTSNFVYDGSVNVLNIVTSSVFLLLVLLYYPRVLRILSAYLLPFIAVACGGFAELTAISTVYATPAVCGASCSFYGMSGVSNGVVGFTIASFLICFGIMVLQRRGRLATIERTPFRSNRARNQIGLVLAFSVYLVLLLAFAGLIVVPSAGQAAPGTGSAAPPPPPAIFTQTPPVAIVHSASLTYGFLLSIGIFFLVNRRYRIFVPSTGGDIVTNA